jgi:uncharacterized membrane protein HdeD (DUF308 family)
MEDAEQVAALASTELKRHRGWAIGVGLVLAALGIAAIVFPLFASLAVEQFVGWILVMSGLVGTLHALRGTAKHGLVLSLLGALLSFAVGIVLVLYPFSGILSLTLLIASFFIAGGLLRIVLALQLRRIGRYGLTLASGVLALAFGVSIVLIWPAAAAWLIGLLVGIDLIFAGIGSLALATGHVSPSRP